MIITLAYALPPKRKQAGLAAQAPHLAERESPQRALRPLDERHRSMASQNHRLSRIVSGATLLLGLSSLYIGIIGALFALAKV